MSSRWRALTKGLEGEELAEIGLLKAAGAVAFTDGAKSVTNAQVMRRALTYAGDFDALVVHHTEDPDLIGDGVMNEGEFAARLGLFGIPKAAETDHAGARHSPRRADARALSRGLDHLRGIARACCAAPRRPACRSPRPPRSITSTLNEIDIGAYRTFFKVVAAAARARTTAPRWSRRLSEGLLDVVMSDHNPQDVETKRLPFAEAAPGAIGLETMLAAGLRLVHSGEMTLIDAAEGDVDAAGRAARPAGRHAQARQRRPT